MNNGAISNTGTATGTPPSGPPVTKTSTVTIPASQTRSISLVKTASIATYSAGGTPVTYSYKVTNTGNVTLTNVGVSDPMVGLSAVSCPASTLLPAATETCTATYTTTLADVNSGSITNTGTASGTPPSGAPVSAQSTVTVPATTAPSIKLVKTASVSGYSAPGTPVTYTYLVTNTGNVTLNPVVVTDPMAGLSAISCPATSLIPGAHEACTATYTTTQADVDHGSISNTGTATGTPPTGPNVQSTSPVTVPATQTPEISVVKSASITSFAAAGTPVTYSYLVTNTGNVTLSSVGVTDPMAGLSAVSCPGSTLAVGAHETCTATYTTTAGDVNAGAISNTGTATGTSPTGKVVNATSTVTVPAVQSPSITILKSANIPSFAAPGTPVLYSYLVTNTGNVALTSVAVTDPMPGLSAVTCPSSYIAAGAQETCTASYRTTQADVDAGSITNTATVTGTPPTGPPVTQTSTVTIPGTQTPAITLVKSGSVPSFSAAGNTITYHYLVTNSGNVTLNPVTVTDPMPGLSTISCPDTQLNVGTNETCSATYTTTQADMDAGSISNTGTTTGHPQPVLP